CSRPSGPSCPSSRSSSGTVYCLGYGLSPIRRAELRQAAWPGRLPGRGALGDVAREVGALVAAPLAAGVRLGGGTRRERRGELLRGHLLELLLPLLGDVLPVVRVGALEDFLVRVAAEQVRDEVAEHLDVLLVVVGRVHLDVVARQHQLV